MIKNILNINYLKMNFAITAIALLIASSNPKEKKLIIGLVINLIRN
jgi:hypothetical protein